MKPSARRVFTALAPATTPSARGPQFLGARAVSRTAFVHAAADPSDSHSDEAKSSAHKVPSHLVGFLSRGNSDGASNTNSDRAKASSVATPPPSLRESAYEDAQNGSSKKGRVMRKQHNNGGDDHSNLRNDRTLPPHMSRNSEAPPPAFPSFDPFLLPDDGSSLSHLRPPLGYASSEQRGAKGGKKGGNRGSQRPLIEPKAFAPTVAYGAGGNSGERSPKAPKPVEKLMLRASQDQPVPLSIFKSQYTLCEGMELPETPPLKVWVELKVSKPHTPEGEENATFSDLKPIVTALQEIGDVKIYGTMYVPRLGGWWMAIGSQVDMNRMLLLDGAPIKDFGTLFVQSSRHGPERRSPEALRPQLETFDLHMAFAPEKDLRRRTNLSCFDNKHPTHKDATELHLSITFHTPSIPSPEIQTFPHFLHYPIARIVRKHHAELHLPAHVAASMPPLFSRADQRDVRGEVIPRSRMALGDRRGPPLSRLSYEEAAEEFGGAVMDEVELQRAKEEREAALAKGREKSEARGSVALLVAVRHPRSFLRRVEVERKIYYEPVKLEETVGNVLKGKTWLEIPELVVWEEKVWKEAYAKGEVGVSEEKVEVKELEKWAAAGMKSEVASR